MNADMLMNSTCRDNESDCSTKSELGDEVENRDRRSSTEAGCSDGESNCNDKSSESLASKQGVEEEDNGEDNTLQKMKWMKDHP